MNSSGAIPSELYLKWPDKILGPLEREGTDIPELNDARGPRANVLNVTSKSSQNVNLE